MKNHPDDLASIEKLIRKEEEEALQAFRKKDFRPQLEARLKAEPKESVSLSLPKKLAPVFVAILLVFVLAIVAIRIFVHSPKMGYVSGFENLLEQSSNMQRINLKDRYKSLAPEEQNPSSSELRESIRSFFSSSGSQKTAKTAGITIPILKINIPKYDLRKRYEILILEKKVYQFLKTYLSDREESQHDSQKLSDSFSFPSFDAALSYWQG